MVSTPCGGYCHALLGQSVHITRHCTRAFTSVHMFQQNHLARKMSGGHSCSRKRDFVRLSVRVRSRQEQRHVQVEKSELAHTEIIYFMFQIVSHTQIVQSGAEIVSDLMPSLASLLLRKVLLRLTCSTTAELRHAIAARIEHG